MRIKSILFLCLLSSIVLLIEGCSSSKESENVIYSVVFHQVLPDHLHGPCVSPDYFRDVLKMIHIGGKQTVSLDTIIKCLKNNNIPQSNYVAHTFDDGWTGAIDYADPMLKQYGMCATSFVATGCIKQGRPRYCTWDDLHKLENSGRWQIHSHSVNHNDFMKIDDKTLEFELQQALSDLRTNGFSGVKSIAYPYGHCDSRITNSVKKNLYQAGFIAGCNARITPQSNRYAIPRTTICQLFDQPLVCCKLGLDIEQVCEKLAIYDETQGTWNEEWNLVKSDPTIPKGLYGYAYLETKAAEPYALNFSVKNQGQYLISLWTPVNIDQGKISINNSGCWRIKSPAGKTIKVGKIPKRIENGWTQLLINDFKPGNYSLELCPHTKNGETFVVDAIKIEQI
jgi:peptidoglycan/xylan/chitin deacetylase (PgdA/CDA1 family)